MIKYRHIKKKAILTTTGLALLLTAFTGLRETAVSDTAGFTTGETLHYRVQYGIIIAGHATVKIDKDLHNISGKPCYRADVYGKSSGLGAIYKVRNHWRSYFDTASMVTQKAYKHLEEGNYKVKETIYFNRPDSDVKVKRIHLADNDREEWSQYSVPTQITDVVGGYYYLRNIDFENKKVGAVIDISTLYDNKVYNLKVQYAGKETIRMPGIGKVKAIKMVPLMPDETIFDGENSVVFWVSDDKNKIPLCIKAKIFIGSIRMNLTGYEGLKYKLATTK